VENAEVVLPSLFDGIDENSFLVLEDGVARDATIQGATKDTKAKGPGRLIVIYDWTDSMRDEHGNAITSTIQLANALQSSYSPLSTYLHTFKDYDGEWRRVGWWTWPSNQLGNYMTAYASDVVDGGFGGNNTIAENPLNAIAWQWSNGAYQGGTQTIFLVVTDGSVHQRGDSDIFDWPDGSGYKTTEVTSVLTGASYNPKGIIYAASSQITDGHYAGTLAYWDNRCSCWTTDQHSGHDYPYNMAVQTGGAWYNLDQHGVGRFYTGKKGESTVPRELTLVYESADAAAKHDIVVTLALEDGRWGEIVFESVNYIEPFDPESYEDPGFENLDDPDGEIPEDIE
jgi:hypothetical protein